MYEDMFMVIDQIEIAEDEAYTRVLESSIDYMHKEMQMLENGLYLEDGIVMEAKSNKPNIFIRIWNGLCRLGRMIRDGIKRLLERIGGWFNKNKTITATPSQICSEMGLGKDSVHQEAALFNKHGKKDTVDTMLNKHAEKMVSPLLVKIKNSKMVIQVAEFNKYVQAIAGGEKVPEKFNNGIKDQKIGNAQMLTETWIMISYPDLVDKLLDVTSDLKTIIEALHGTKHVDDTGVKNVSKKLDEFRNDLYSKMMGSIKNEITVDEIRQFDKKFNQFTKTLSTLNELRTPYQTDSSLWKRYDLEILLKRLVNIYELVPMGMNIISNAITESMVVDAKYYKVISQPDLFAKFIFKMLAAHIPPKYVAYNAYLVTTPEFNGYNGKYEPKWGQSRCVFTPKNKPDIVYKFPLQMWGQKANKNEAQITNLFKAKHIDTTNILSAVVKTYENFMLIECEYCDDLPAGKVVNDAKLTQFSELPDHIPELKKYGFNFQDLHQDNLGVNKHGDIIIRDYGMLVKKLVLTRKSQEEDYKKKLDAYDERKEEHEELRKDHGTHFADLFAHVPKKPHSPDSIGTQTRENLQLIEHEKH
jgi:hypothetical protein